MEEAEFIRHAPCPDCGSSDALAVYEDHTFCFKCHTWKGDGTKSHSSARNAMTIPLCGEATPLKNRGITEQTCEKFKIYREGSKLRFYYHNKDGQPIGAKVRTAKKDFSYEGATEGTFFGQHLFPSSGKRVVITEGEMDAASVWEAMPNWPVVSVPTGAAGAKKAVQRNLEWLQGYETIVLFFDNDDAGLEAAKATAQVLPPGKVKFAALQGFKDASDALQAGDRHTICKAIWDAKPYRPDGIVEGRNLLEVITTEQQQSKHDYPFQGLQRLLHGIRPGELTTITAGSGIGKSSFCRQIASGLLQKGERVGYLALEESVRRTSLGLMSVGVKKPLHIGEHSYEELAAAFDSTMATWNCYLFDGFGSYDPDIIYNRIEYLASGLDCQIVFLDHLSILLSGLDGDERKMIDQTMTRLRSLVERTGIHLFLVSHLRRSQQDNGHEEGARVSLSQLRGSASIAQLSDSVIGLERNQQSECDSGETTCRVIKNRYSGETGVACTLSYDLQTCTFNETKEFNPSTDF